LVHPVEIWMTMSTAADCLGMYLFTKRLLSFFGCKLFN